MRDIIKIIKKKSIAKLSEENSLITETHFKESI
jgi:hypothetical protein